MSINPLGRREFFRQAALAGAAGAAPGALRAIRRNVLCIIADQHNAGCIGIDGHPRAITPNLDRLSREGVRFRSAYTQNPICTPSRVSILSGQYVHNHGFYGLGGRAPRLPSFFSHFRAQGYRTAAFGKIHVPEDGGHWLAEHCDLLGDCYRYGEKPSYFSDRYEAYLRSHGVLDKEDSVLLPEFPGVQQHEGRPSLLPYAHSVEGWSTAEAMRFIDASGGQPFAVQVALPRPHQCYTPDQRFWDMYPANLELPRTLRNSPAGRPPHFRGTVEGLKNHKWLIEPRTFEEGCRRVWRGYLACITQVDFAVGQMLDHLGKTGKLENTIVIYGADHGAYSGAFGIPEKAPGICSEAVCRVPFIWRVPGLAGTGVVSRELVENVDIAPTITSLCGLPPMETADGCDLTPLLQGGDKPLREIAVTENPWSKAVRWGPWRFVHYQREMFGHDVGELYNLEKDPDETRNLYEDAAHQPVVSECRRLLLEWLIRTTRVVSVHPMPRGATRYSDAAAGDGKESNKYGPAERVHRGSPHYL
jgi:choline-sulfatase/uncharacterized sulfatase